MQLILTFLITLALAFGQPSAPAMVSAPTTHVAPARTLAQPATFTVNAEARIIELTTRADRPFTAAYTSTVALSSTAVITVVTTLPSYAVIAAAPGCVRLAPQSSAPSLLPLLPGPIRLLCTIAAESDQAIAIPIRFTVPWDVRGVVRIDSTIGGTETISASFILPPQVRLALIRR